MKDRTLVLRIVVETGADLGRSGLAVPDLERAKIHSARVFKRLHKVIARRRLAIVAIEIEVGASAEFFGPKNGMEHPNELRALVVDSRRVKVGDLDVAVRANRVRKRPLVFGKLRCAQNPHVFDALNGSASDIGREALVTKNGEAFLEAELEPVAAGDAITGPIVEIFVRDDARDVVEITVGRGLLIGEHIGGVEDIERLVLHCAHVEVADGNDVELSKVILAAVDLLI